MSLAQGGLVRGVEGGLFNGRPQRRCQLHAHALRAGAVGVPDCNEGRFEGFRVGIITCDHRPGASRTGETPMHQSSHSSD